MSGKPLDADMPEAKKCYDISAISQKQENLHYLKIMEKRQEVEAILA